MRSAATGSSPPPSARRPRRTPGSGDGLRRSAATGAQATKTIGFVVDRTLGAGNVVAERTGSGALLRRYTYGLDLLAQTTSNKGPYWYHHDGLGSVTDITSATGSPLAWTEYTPFGTPRASAATSQAPVNPFRFSGEYQDGSTALYHLRARQYDPTTGRFTSPDPFGPGIGDPYVSAYVYVANNPVRYTDPSGRESIAPQPGPGPDPGLFFAKGGKQNIRDSGLRDVPNEEVSRRARDPNLSPQERQRYIREEKARGLRNKDKRSNFEVYIDPAAVVEIGVGGVLAYGAYRVVRLLPSLVPALWWTLPANAAIP